MDRRRWGLAGLLAFEAIIAAYTLGNNNLLFSAMYAIGAVMLALAVWRGPARWHFAVLAVAAAVRAYIQTQGGAPLGVWVTWLVPLGFGWLALMPHVAPRAGVASVALARTWFIGWYFFLGSPIVAAANVLGAAGAWLWAAAAEPPVEGAPQGASAGDGAPGALNR